jgi:hypothetical protein
MCEQVIDPVPAIPEFHMEDFASPDSLTRKQKLALFSHSTEPANSVHLFAGVTPNQCPKINNSF